MEKIRPRRSVLFMPGSNARAIEKARTLECDVVVLDLEDAVSPDAKELARTQACEAVKNRSFGARDVAIRINASGSPWYADDIAAVAKAGPGAVILPKVGVSGDIAQAHRLLPDDIAIWVMIETPAAVLNVSTIAGAGARCLILGSNDLTKDMRGLSMPSQENLWAAMSLTVLAARAHGLDVIDGTYNAVEDMSGLAAACERGRAFGFDGKTLIHPSQIETANRIFAPDEAAVAQARRIIAAFADNPDKSVLLVDGRMVETLHAQEAARLLALADAIAARC